MLKKHEINLITNYFKDKPVLKAYLFGSYVRNESETDSDIDILVELDYSQQIGLKYVRMQNELQEILKTKVDLLSTNAVSKYIRPVIDREKRLIYEKPNR
ncbi:MAG: nucleotidyltransferase domain-containing protein [Candidatus Neomarinimicrobiota bacterium]